MPEALMEPVTMASPAQMHAPCRVAVIWIDWYAYHVARFRGLASAPSLAGRVAGVELVGGVGVHAGLKFREELPPELAVDTLMPQSSWAEADKLKLSRLLWTKLDALDPEVVLVPGYYTLPGITAALWARVHGRVSVLMTESTAGDHARVWWKEAAKGWLLRRLFDWAVAGGTKHVDYLRELHFPSNRVVGCYDVVDNEMFATGTQILRSRGATQSDIAGPYFLYVGRFAEEKNVAGLLSAWFAYRQAGGSWPLVLVGGGPLKDRLREQAAASGYAAEVHLPGLKSSHELLPFYAFAGCFVLPSTREPWGLVVNEAMASGLPVLVSDRCGCAADLVQAGSNGFVFTPGHPPALTSLLHQMEDLPAAQRARMGQRSSNLIGNFSPGAFGAEIARIVAAKAGAPTSRSG